MPNIGPTEDGQSALAEREQRILAFERQWWKFEGSKEQAIRDEFGFSATRYYQLLNGLVERPEALAFDPMTVKRLRRLRADRRRQRNARQLGIQL
ncbi:MULTISPECIES: DUF3263 domain-containing protein [Nocardiopsis]|jgi:hypothetical protein|uniref:DUF3263 domain-containing protein n=5 Tax=Nocardiopsis TaxID=2013 RepID=D7AV52_NOCDD|nr:MULTISPECIES: DUF3263 domain-containing protein [Nocardiopsis]PDP85468.1 DUF3263 domain-containing protein [Glycomyces fuscus]ADH69602.1 conserved hypothetical protein [Nocardiopsis dassonvillei subsp. dassonvillei DSM 43111]APC37602.1 hypothetical protein A9R04_24290 [Nocardiopsis dassonvillei]ASU60544.1 DUF3263 domain-containing protein [Nocardiopsis dassonvillei]MCK9871067.1 DUF3263 domain-containing protein [Nocardiopsis dassonvillei]